MATIKDIARAAGVSHATVSNVLNHKGNVSAQKVKLVMDTARAMGYRVNEAASALRSGYTQTMAVILPDTGSQAYDDLYRSLCQTAAEYGFNTLLRLTENVLGTEMRAIEDVLASRARCAVVVTSLPDAAQRYELLRRAGIEVLFAIRGEQKGFLYAGFDLAAAAREMAHRVMAEGASSIGLMTSMTCYPSQEAFRTSFLSEARGCRVTCVESVAAQYGKQAFSLFDTDGPDAIVTTSEEMARAVIDAGAILGKSPRVYALTPTRVISPTTYGAYELNYRRLGLEIGRMLLDERAERRNIEGTMCGFAQRTMHYAAREAGLSLLTADTPVARALERLLPRLKKDTGLHLSITTKPTHEVSAAFAHPEQIGQFDLARMDLSLMDRWATALFSPLESLRFDLHGVLDRLLPGLVQEYAMVEGEMYALPFDPGCHLMFYREDLWSDPHIQREYFERWHAPLEVPKDRESFLRAAEFLQGINLREWGIGHPLLLTRRASECLSALSAMSEGRQLMNLHAEEIEKYIAGQRTLERCAGIVESGDWRSAVSRFARGECAMLIAHSNYARHLADEPLSSVSGRVGFALPPGGCAFLGGGVIGTLKSSPRQTECAAFLNWLFSPQISRILALLSGCSPLAAAYESEELHDIYPWLGAVRSGLASGMRRQLFSVEQTCFDRMAVEDCVAQLCEDAVHGCASAEETLVQMKRLFLNNRHEGDA